MIYEYMYHNTGVEKDRNADMDNKDIRELWVEPVFFRRLYLTWARYSSIYIVFSAEILIDYVLFKVITVTNYNCIYFLIFKGPNFFLCLCMGGV